MERKYALGIRGLGVRGCSQAQHFARNGYPTTGYGRIPRPQEDVTASDGEVLDLAITLIRPYLQPGNTTIDGGNTLFTDTERRAQTREGRPIGLGLALLTTSASLAYFDTYRSAILPANLTQAQRDFFGAHTYRRTDRAGVFHTQWEE